MSLQGNDDGAGFGVDGTSVNNNGVLGTSTSGFGVFGFCQNGEGVHGEADGSSAAVGALNRGPGPAVFGIAQTGEGVHGETSSGTFAGVSGSNKGSGFGVFGFSSSGEGVHGEADGSRAAVGALNRGPGPAVFGIAQTGEGVHGETSSGTFAGVSGSNKGSGAGVFGFSSSGEGVHGEADGSSAAVGAINRGPGPAVFGIALNHGGTGVHGESTGGVTGIGVAGISATGSGVAATSSNVTTPSILGRHPLPGGVGVAGYNPATTGNGVGVFGKSDSAQRGDQPAIGVWGYCPQGLAGVFSGDVLADHDMTVTGTFTAANKLFKLDHPLDPANRYLVHACVESFEMINVYSGNVTTDAAGDATVSLPEYFQAINTDCRYQLTVMGQFAHAVVSSEIQNNRFAIKTDKPSVKVSWQVTGLRQDNYAKAHGLITEQEKSPVERGLFLHPELFNEPAEKALGIPKSRSASIALNYDIK